MSRIGLKPVPLPKGVEIKVGAGKADVKGPKGALSVAIPTGISVSIADGIAKLARTDDSKPQKSLHGLTRALLANAVKGVSDGYERSLEIVGTGYRAEAAGNTLKLALGFSHPVQFDLPQGVSARVDKNTLVVLTAIDKHLLGQVAADLRKLRPPDAYKGKGIRYAGEHLTLKPGKAAGK